MPQTTSLQDKVKPPLQVIALDSRRSEQVVSDKQYLKILQMSDLLSRSLIPDDILRVFSQQIGELIKHSGLRYVANQLGQPVRIGAMAAHSLNYQLTIEQMNLGSLTAYRESPFSSNEVCQFEDLLCALVYPLKNAILHQVALVSAYRDPITNINNRAAMDKMLPREVSLAKRHDHSLALMIMDLDGFKQVNDGHGHDVGDRVLREVAGCVQHSLRDTDMMFRYGGDEFVVALPHTNTQGALDVAERILAAVEVLRDQFADEQIEVGLSIGLSMLHAGDDFELLFKRVDEALYQAKRSGKNRAVIA